MTKLVIVESPTKAKTIRNFLPKEYKVEASMGHVRDLPASASEIPAKVKGEPWARLGVNVEDDFDPLYVTPASKKKVVTKLRALLKDADELILATDEDREGESIGWHLYEVLKPKVPVKRMVFHEITKDAIEAALNETRPIDENLVRAQEARRIVDRLVGYTVSPLLWKKIAPKLSAGRVQSVAVRLLVQRERERRAFRSGTYWDLKALLNKRPDQPAHRFEAQLVSVGGVRVASGRDFDEHTGKIAEGKEVLLLDEAQTQALQARLLAGTWRVSGVDTRDATRSPYPPFTTSTLQQEANRKLGMGAKQTMQVAQKLYENGFITYMRTDSVNLSTQAVTAARRRVTELYGQEYLSPKPRRYQTKSKGAQEAHEAIRPAGDQMLPADRQPLSGQERALYDLIWKRTVSTQMANARLKFSTVTVEVEDAAFRASGRQVVFPGFFRAYVEGSDDPEAALEDQESPLPELAVDEEVDCQELSPVGHETKPPARFTEASLVKALEAEGIGRPSTYATIIDTIQHRGYVFKQRKELVPTFTAFATTALLEDHFSNLVDFGFTAEMEQKLDDIAAGDRGWLEFLRAFYLGQDGLENRVKEKEGSIDPRDASRVNLADLPAEVRIGQFGPFVARGENDERVTVGLPPDVPPADLDAALVEELLNRKEEGPQSLGKDPETGLDILVKVGPYGPYVQLGENGDTKGKPKRVSLLKGMEVEDVDLPLALKLLSLPRTLGTHPEDEKPVQAGVGRYGPYVVHNRRYVSLKAPDHVLDVNLERALALLAAAPAKKGRAARTVLKDLGVHPDDEQPIQVLDGRYGPYVNHGKINATLPKDVKPEEVTLEQALGWIAEKAAKKGGSKRTTKRKTTAKKSTAKKTTAKKTTKKTTKKSTAKKAPAKKTTE